jgi:hypothetical protein
MSKKKTPKETKPTTTLGTLAHFRAWLAEADREALEVVIHHGFVPHIQTIEDREHLDAAVEWLAKQFAEPYPDSDVDDDHVLFEELNAKQDAALMMGIALGLRLKDSELADALKGEMGGVR